MVTPTYDRGHVLGRLYDSLCAQTFDAFEWLVIDDGSSDETRQLISDWQDQGRIQIRYLAQPNSGKHVALNRAFATARGQFCAVVDSDDWYLPQTLERLLVHWERIDPRERDRFAGVEGLCSTQAAKLVGTPFPRDVFDSDTLDIRFVHDVQGDTVGMFRTDILRAFPFPEDLGRFVPEALVWWRIGAHFKSRFVNEILGYKEYLPGGLSDRGAGASIAASSAYARLFFELATTLHRLPVRVRLRACVHYVRYACHARMVAPQPLRAAALPVWAVGAPLGLALFIRDLRLSSRTRR